MMWQGRFIAARVADLPQFTSADGLCSSFMVNAALRRSRHSMIPKADTGIRERSCWNDKLKRIAESA
jgi:hypothetical protein